MSLKTLFYVTRYRLGIVSITWENCYELAMFMDLQQYMDSEIRAIMAQYMPLDSQPEVPNHTNDERA